MRLTVLVLVVATLGACASGFAGTSSGTALTVTYWKNSSRMTDPKIWTLRCNPVRGTLARPDLACRRLTAASVRLFAPLPPDMACTQIYGGPQMARVIGTIAGKRVWATFSRTDGCQISRWERLSPWLLPAGAA